MQTVFGLQQLIPTTLPYPHGQAGEDLTRRNEVVWAHHETKINFLTDGQSQKMSAREASYNPQQWHSMGATQN